VRRSRGPSEDETIPNQNRPSVKTRFTDAEAGIKKNIPSDVTIGGVKYTQASLMAVFSDAVSAIDRADALHTQWLESVAEMKTTVANANAVYKLLRNFLIGSYGTSAKSTLGDFGMSAPKVKSARKASTKAVAAVKAKATRKLRNTMGSKQKKQVKSDVEVQITPVPATEPAATQAPATAATTPATAPAAAATPVKTGS
jgi:hypothetical protein